MQDAVVVTLKTFEIELAGHVAMKRVMFNLERHARERYGAISELGGFDYHFAGCLGEIATAKHCNLYWSGGVGDYGVADVGNRLQVRARTRSHYELPLHNEDKDADPFVLVHVIASCLPRVRLAGWVRAAEGKKPEFWKDPGSGRPAFFVPLNHLRSMKELDL